MEKGQWGTFQSLEEEVGASQEEDGPTIRCLSTRKWVVNCRCQTCQSLMGKKAEDALELKGRIVMG